MSRYAGRAGWVIAVVATIALVAAVAQVVQGGPLDPPRSPGSTGQQLIFQPAGGCPTGFPITISSPGSYRLAENITGCTGQDGIAVTTSGVTLDLAGFSVTGVAGSLTGIHASCVSACEEISILNGYVRNWGTDGIGFDATVTSSAVEHVTVAQSGQRGISFLGSENAARDCVVHDSGVGNANIFVGNRSIVERCLAAGTGPGITLAGASSVARQNTIEKQSNAYGINLWNATDTAEDNDVGCNDYTGSVGIYLGTATNGSIVQHNRVEACSWGIYMQRIGSAAGKANIIDGNIVDANSIGIQVDQGSSASQLNLVQRNVATANGDGAQNYVIVSGLLSGNAVAVIQQAGSATAPYANISN